MRYLINLTFSSNVAGTSRGNDICDNSSIIASAYSSESVVNCTSTSSPTKFYGAVNNIILDCLFESNCPTDYFYVSTTGTDFPFCGSSVSPCLSLVWKQIIFLLFVILHYLFLIFSRIMFLV